MGDACSADVYFPAGELGGEAHVLTALTNSEGLLIGCYIDDFVCVSSASLISTLMTFLRGERASSINVRLGFSDHSIISSIFFARELAHNGRYHAPPRWPISPWILPGSTWESLECTAILLREPASRATALTSTVPFADFRRFDFTKASRGTSDENARDVERCRGDCLLRGRDGKRGSFH